MVRIEAGRVTHDHDARPAKEGVTIKGLAKHRTADAMADGGQVC
jgi:hypothetical protein